MIASHHAADSSSDAFDDAGAFVTQHNRHIRPAHRAVHDVQAAVAHAAGRQTHQHLARMRLVQVHLFDHHWFTHLDTALPPAWVLRSARLAERLDLGARRVASHPIEDSHGRHSIALSSVPRIRRVHNDTKSGVQLSLWSGAPFRLSVYCVKWGGSNR